MDNLDENFALGILNDRPLSVPLRHAVALGKRILNKYYELSDSSDIYRLSMGTLYLFLSSSWRSHVLSPSSFLQNYVLRPVELESGLD